MIIIPDDIKNEYVIHISKAELAEALALLSKKDMEAKLYHRVKHGRWVDTTETVGWPKWSCSVCGGDGRGDYEFCPWCGAKMDEVEE